MDAALHPGPLATRTRPSFGGARCCCGRSEPLSGCSARTARRCRAAWEIFATCRAFGFTAQRPTASMLGWLTMPWLWGNSSPTNQNWASCPIRIVRYRTEMDNWSSPGDNVNIDAWSRAWAYFAGDSRGESKEARYRAQEELETRQGKRHPRAQEDGKACYENGEVQGSAGPPPGTPPSLPPGTTPRTTPGTTPGTTPEVGCSGYTEPLGTSGRAFGTRRLYQGAG
jgi:hypothetical protein